MDASRKQARKSKQGVKRHREDGEDADNIYSGAPKRGGSRAKRPVNAFLVRHPSLSLREKLLSSHEIHPQMPTQLWCKEYRREMHKSAKLCNREASVRLGRVWEGLPEEYKLKYRLEAQKGFDERKRCQQRSLEAGLEPTSLDAETRADEEVASNNDQPEGEQAVTERLLLPSLLLSTAASSSSSSSSSSTSPFTTAASSSPPASPFSSASSTSTRSATPASVSAFTRCRGLRKKVSSAMSASPSLFHTVPSAPALQLASLCDDPELDMEVHPLFGERIACASPFPYMDDEVASLYAKIMPQRALGGAAAAVRAGEDGLHNLLELAAGRHSDWMFDLN